VTSPPPPDSGSWPPQGQPDPGPYPPPGYQQPGYQQPGYPPPGYQQPGPAGYPPAPGDQPAAGGYPPGYGGHRPGGGAQGGTDERNWALAAHLGSFATGFFLWLPFLFPLIVMLVKGPQSPYIRRHAVESLNFQINAFAWFIVNGILFFVLIGWVTLPLFALYWVIMVIVASVKTSNGEDFRYPLTLRLVS
jgi:uncharacterized protein